MNALKKSIKNFEILTPESFNNYNKKITIITKQVLPKSMLRKEDK